MTADKGAHRAIAVAIERGLPLKLAGKCREPLEQQYFDELVRPHLSDRIEYVGEVTHGEKVELLQHARATLFPIEWDEPFGLVMIESMACGTPVIATRFGAVPEVIDDGVTGVIVPSWRDMGDALERADAIDPQVQRRVVEERFSPRTHGRRLRRGVRDDDRAVGAPAGRLSAGAPPLRVRPADPAARAARARRARGRAAVHPRRHGDRRSSRPLAACGARRGRDGALGARDLQLPPVRDDRPGRPRERRAARTGIARRLGAQALWLSLGVGVVLAAAIALLARADRRARRRRGPDAPTTRRPTCASSRSACRRSSSRSAARASSAASSDLTSPLVVIVLGNVLNLVLEVLFVYGFDWGIEGSAWGTALAQTCMGARLRLARRAPGRAGRPRAGRPACARRLLSVGKFIFARTPR